MNYERSDKIYIRNLVIPTIIGVHAQERKKPRDIILNLILHTATAEAAEADDIELAVDYEALCTKLVEYVRASSFALIESLANALANLLLDTKKIIACKVVLDKPGALNSCESVAVEIFRKSRFSP
ncbi:hypothetical protein S1OALGB6SA_246 [Olavius algarvensis spirochete endosymbiont]|uniref:dihydroneopterin aldolase n=1 Tax=Olavius algarvensis spirochete endosymbiont TaxID=260710 RepID=UPI000F1829D8|nr:dihydroneopterin aldolase [Olavius algarvensis spirochete endosymbiont]VDA99183.1 hypothetical protein S1OALGB6SA_246 [Olavius algarvensis spirochete endosymbiont]